MRKKKENINFIIKLQGGKQNSFLFKVYLLIFDHIAIIYEKPYSNFNYTNKIMNTYLGGNMVVLMFLNIKK